MCNSREHFKTASAAASIEAALEPFKSVNIFPLLGRGLHDPSRLGEGGEAPSQRPRLRLGIEDGGPLPAVGGTCARFSSRGRTLLHVSHIPTMNTSTSPLPCLLSWYESGMSQVTYYFTTLYIYFAQLLMLVTSYLLSLVQVGHLIIVHFTLLESSDQNFHTQMLVCTCSFFRVCF